MSDTTHKYSPLSRRNRLHEIRTAFRLVSLALALWVQTVSATDLTIQLADNATISRQKVGYQCDSTGNNLGVPSGSFSVEYVNGGGNSLAIVPIAGNRLIFSNVVSGSGARYTAKQYTWWEAKGSVTLSSDSLEGKLQSSCRRVDRK